MKKKQLIGLLLAGAIAPFMLASCNNNQGGTDGGTPTPPIVNPPVDPVVKENKLTLLEDENFNLTQKELVVNEGETFKLEVPNLEGMYEFHGWFTNEGIQITDETGKSIEAWDGSLGDISLKARYYARFTYEEREDGYLVAGNENTMELVDVVIPESYKGKPVVEIGDFANHLLVKTVSLPNSIKVINETSFNESPVLKAFEVYEANGVKKPSFISKDGVIYSADESTLVKYPIAKDAVKFDVPKTVTKLEAYSFYGVVVDYKPVGALKEVTLPATIEVVGSHAFYDRGGLEKVSFASASKTKLEIGAYAFARVGLKNFAIPKNTVSIGEGAFAGELSGAKVSFVENLVLPEGLTSIGANAFALNKSLKSLTLPSTIEFIGQAAFKGAGITELHLPKTAKLEKLSAEVFSTTNFTTIEIPSYIKIIDDMAFEKSDLVEVNILPGVMSIGHRAFGSSDALTKITLPNTVGSVMADWIENCPNLTASGLVIPSDSQVFEVLDGVIYNKGKTEIYLYPSDKQDQTYVMPNTVERIPAYLFKEHEFIKNVTLSGSLKEIPAYAFYGANIDSITIPASVTRIDESAFGSFRGAGVKNVTFAANSSLMVIGKRAFDHTNITKLDLPEGLEVIEDGAFTSSKLVTINIPSTVTSINSMAFGGVSAKVKEINVSANNKNYQSVDGVLYTKDMTNLVCYPVAKTAKEIVLPDTVVEISDRALSRTKATKVSGKNVKKLGYDAFYNSKVVTIDFPNLEDVGERAFGYCSNLATIDLAKVLKLGINAFSGCSSLTSIKLNNALELIPESAFAKTGITSIVIPGSVKQIDAFAFQDSMLKEVVIEEGLLTLGEGAFQYNMELESIKLPNSLRSIGANAFDGFKTDYSGNRSGLPKLKTINIPSGVKFIGNNVFLGSVLETITVAKDNRWFTMNEENNLLLSKDMTKLLYVVVKLGLTELVVPEGVLEISDNLFNNLTELVKITFPASLESVGNSLFIGSNALTKIEVSANNKFFTSKDGVLYSKDMEILYFYPFGKQETKFVVPSEVEVLSETAFAGAPQGFKLTELVLGANVKRRHKTTFADVSSIKTLEINSQEMIEQLEFPNLAGYDEYAITAYVKTLRIKKGLAVNKYVTAGFELSQEVTNPNYDIYVPKKA